MRPPSQEFSAKNLGWMRRRRRQFGLTPDTAPLPRRRKEWKEFLSALERRVATEDLKFNRTKVAHLSKGGKTRQLVISDSLDEVLVLRRINENIRRAYSVKAPDRDHAIRTLSQALAEGTDKQVFRLDIKSCFESISLGRVRTRLIKDGLVSFQTLTLLDEFFGSLRINPNYRQKRGLPRGLAISGTLAEIYLAEFESRIRLIEGVYLVLRYVDDLVVVSSRVDASLSKDVKKIASDLRLKLNVKKSHSYLVACSCAVGCAHGTYCPCKRKCKCPAEPLELEYLGYRINFNSRNDKVNCVEIGISRSKIKKIKSRIVLSVRSYLRDGDFSLFIDRLAVLTGNVQIISGTGRRSLATGLSYTHALSQKSEAMLKHDLGLLTSFLHKSIAFAFRLKAAQNGAEHLAYKYDFERGFRQRRRVKLSAERLKRVTDCWRHV